MWVIAFYFSLSHPAWTQFIAVFQIGAVERALEVGCACELINLSVCESVHGCESVRVYLCVCVLTRERTSEIGRKREEVQRTVCFSLCPHDGGGSPGKSVDTRRPRSNERDRK